MKYGTRFLDKYIFKKKKKMLQTKAMYLLLV